MNEVVEVSRKASKKRKADNILDKPPKKYTEWNFAVDYNDHFETPRVAYCDIMPMLMEIADSLKKTLSELIIYDPYWCQGSMVSHLKSLGCNNVINLNRDFYKDISTNKIPGYRILYVCW